MVRLEFVVLKVGSVGDASDRVREGSPAVEVVKEIMYILKFIIF